MNIAAKRISELPPQSSANGLGPNKLSEIPAEAWLALAVLMVVYVLNIADRFVLSVLIEPIKAEFALSDSSVGFLTGVALAIFYVTAGLPLGALADRSSRKKIIAFSVAAWSTMTIFCGLSSTYWQLLLARIGVGVGEAGGTPPSQSLLAAKFPPKSRAMAISIWALGASLGSWLGASGAGMLNELYGWRMTLIVFGVCGLPISILVWYLIREPDRSKSDDGAAASEVTSTLADTLKFMWCDKALFHLTAGVTVITFWGWGILWWTPSFLVRSFHLSVGDAAAMLGPMHGLGGSLVMLGTVAAMGYLMRKPLSWQPDFVAITTLLGTIPSILIFYTESLDVAVWSLWIFIPIIYAYIGPSNAIGQNLFPVHMRAKGAAILVLFANVANLAVAPQLIGFLSDVVAPNLNQPADSLRHVLLGCAFTGVWAAYHYWVAARILAARSSQHALVID